MRSWLRRAALTTLLTAAAFLAGLSFDHAAQAAKKPEPYRPLDVYADVLAHVENSYVEEVDEKDLVYGSIEGLVAKLDPHSVFLRPEAFKSLRDETTGEFDGLGLELTVRAEQLVIISPVADSPAERAGLQPGDRVLAIDGAPTRDLTLAEAMKRLKGPVGSKVVLEVMRDAFTAPQKLTVVRDRVRLQSVEWRVLDAGRHYAYVRIKVFQERTDRALRKALDDARSALHGELRGLVLDLRNDPGGLLDQAVRVADAWLASGIIVSTEGRARRNVEVEKAREKDTEPGYPLIVLVNKGTASASEIVAGALQDHQRAVIMGTQTFGKGSVQTIIELEDGSGLKLTVARYFTPRHRSIQELGITPDVVVADAAPPSRDPGPGEKDLKRHLKNDAGERPAGPAQGAGDDYQLRTALDYLKAVDILKAPGREPAKGVAVEPAPAGR
jgi:carboxyl-terminal processing protease